MPSVFLPEGILQQNFGFHMLRICEIFNLINLNRSERFAQHQCENLEVV